MIKYFCDNCGKELADLAAGDSEIDTYATEERESYHFHVRAVGMKLCPEDLSRLLQESLSALVPPAEPKSPVKELLPKEPVKEHIYHEVKKR